MADRDGERRGDREGAGQEDASVHGQGTRQSRLLHAGGAAGTWGNHGLWSEARDYASACTALADAVGEAAGLQPGQRVLALACGAGDELVRWARRFRVAEVVGVERDARQLARAERLVRRDGAGARVLLRSGELPGLLDGIDGMPGTFDAVTCVDAIYHVPFRARLARQVLSLLRPCGRFAFTDLVTAAPRPSVGLRFAARACGVAGDELLDVVSREAQLREAGFVDVRCRRLDDEVLGGFARFVARQQDTLGPARWHPSWWGVAVTARLVPPCRTAGLGYALFSARRP